MEDVGSIYIETELTVSLFNEATNCGQVLQVYKSCVPIDIALFNRLNVEKLIKKAFNSVLE